MTNDGALRYLETLVNHERVRSAGALREVRLERMQQLCAQLGEPQRAFRSVLVAGTAGKGSVCELLYRMLRAGPLRAGLYTSPHLEDVRERIRLWTGGTQEPGTDDDPPTRLPADGRWGDDRVAAEDFAQAVEQVEAAARRLGGGIDGPPTYFEVLTAAAFEVFRRRGVQVAVVEVGLGGRLDATNVLEPAVSIFTPIDLDHTEVLGDTPAAIAREKAGILKPGQQALSAQQPEGVLAVLREACQVQGVPLLVAGQDVTWRVTRHDLQGLEVSLTGLRGVYEALRLPLIGRHQAQNASLAIAALELLADTGIPASLVERGLAQARCPGRLEVVRERPLVLLDGAHNPASARALAAALHELCAGRRIHLLVGMSGDKSVEGFGEALGQLVVGATCVRSAHPRAMPAQELARRLAPYCDDVHVMSEPADAYTCLLNAAAPEDVLVVTGSLFLVGQVRASLRLAAAGREPAPVAA
jgi:dihydrofolate synthase/folylpolyglutamate synthase